MQKYFFDYSITFTVFQFYDTGQKAFMDAIYRINAAVQYAALHGMAENGEINIL
jgi:hypothetical protein